MALCYFEPELLPIEGLHCGNSDFRPFCSSDLDRDPLTFIYEFDPYLVEMYRICENEFHSQGFSKVILLQTDRQTEIHTPPKLHITPLCGTG